jgi:hypothetical protein
MGTVGQKPTAVPVARIAGARRFVPWLEAVNLRVALACSRHGSTDNGRVHAG